MTRAEATAAVIAAAAFAEGLKLAGKNLSRDSFRKGLESIDMTFNGIKMKMSSDNHQARSEAYLAKLRNGKLASVDIFEP